MRQVLFRRGKIIVDDVPAPMIEPGHLLVEVAYSLISAGTEISNVQSSKNSPLKKAIEQPEKVKQILDYLHSHGLQNAVIKLRATRDKVYSTGYSCSGIVIQVGKGVTDIKKGDRVACTGAGIANHAEIVVVPRNLVVMVPKKCDLKSAASVAIGSIAMHGIRRTDPNIGEYVAVIGLGLIGQITVQLLKVAGCRVIGIDLDDRRVNLSKKMGADYTFNPQKNNIINEIRHITGDFGVDATIITASSPSDDIVQQAMEITRKKGRVVVVGDVGLGLRRAPLYEKEIDFLISSSYGPGRYDERYEQEGVDYPYAYVRWTENRNMHEYLHLIAEQKIKLDHILEREFDVRQAESAYAELQSDEEKPLGVLLAYSSEVSQFDKDNLKTKVLLSKRPVSDKINVAVVGAGNFAKTMHLPNLKKLSDLYYLRAVVSATGNNAKMTAKQFGADYASTNFHEVLDDNDIDMVLIATRHHLHATMAIQAAQAGKAIFLEKPMAINQTELDELVLVLKETQVPFTVGFNRRFSPGAKRVKENLIDHQSPLMILYRVNAGYMPPEHWTRTEDGGGRIIGEACHMLDFFQYLNNSAAVVEVVTNPITLSGENFTLIDNVVATVLYDDGSTATLFYTALGSIDLSKEYIEIYIDGKVLVIDDFKKLRICGKKVNDMVFHRPNKGHLEILKNFGCYIKGERGIPISLSELIQTTELSIIVADQAEPISQR